jgi:Rod binding domain-containing protein
MSPIEQALKLQSNLEVAKPKLASLKSSCDGMESAFLKQIVSSMRKSAGSVHFGKDFGGDMYRDMFDGTISDMLAEKGTVGIGRAMFASVAPRVLNEAVTEKHSMEGK